MKLSPAKLKRDLARMIADNGEVLWADGREIAVEAEEMALELFPELERFASGDSVAVVMVNDPGCPENDALVEFRDKTWRVQMVRVDTDKVGRLLMLGPVLGGR